MADGPDRHLGRTIGGRYTIDAVLGHGGMAEVFVARQAPLGRRVALKLIRRDYANDPRLIARFEREARALAQLSDPHVVTLLDFGSTDEGELFMAMELLEGETLRARLRRVGALDVRAALDLAQQICRGLAAAHKVGVVHRDLKPENIMLTRVSAARGEADFVKVLDLGVARVPTGEDHQTLTEQGKLVGTPGYMAPEMLLYGALEDPRSDLYALGVILFEMLTGEAVFSAPTPIALVTKHAHEAPRHIDIVWPDVDRLVQQLLRKEPSERPPDAGAVMQQIAEVLAQPRGQTPRAVPVGAVDVNAATAPKLQTPLTAAKPPAPSAPVMEVAAVSAPRGRGRVALGVAAALVLAALTGGALVAWTRLSDEEQHAADAGHAPSTAHTVAPVPTPAPPATDVRPPAADAGSAPAVDHALEPTPVPVPTPATRPPRPPRPRPPPSQPNDPPKPRHVPDLTP
ncbi:MAG: serine/threonine protein kinase [Deltaproteobacteria bacterium]|nr:serine/threonine protein kinase [Deltaproteobacteria bacterium]